MSARHTGILTLAAAGIASLLLTGTAIAGPMGGGLGGTTMMQGGGTGTGMGGTTGTTGTTMMPPGTGAGSGAGSGSSMGSGHMFTDVAAGDWYAPYAEHMAAAGFMTGFDNGTFGAELPITRGQFASVLGHMMGLEPATGTAFTDTQGFWAAGMVEAMARRGIITGHDDGTFGPYDAITREQMAAMMDRAWDVMHGSTTPADMANAMTDMMQLVDDAAGSWAAPQIARMLQMGVFMGDHGLFHPTDTATRAQAAAVMWRWFTAGQPQQ
jgi:hypothetical protein